jgi:hypothetical protein
MSCAAENDTTRWKASRGTGLRSGSIGSDGIRGVSLVLHGVSEHYDNKRGTAQVERTYKVEVDIASCRY